MEFMGAGMLWIICLSYTFFKTLCWIKEGYIATFTGDADSFVWFILTAVYAGLPVFGAIVICCFVVISGKIKGERGNENPKP